MLCDTTKLGDCTVTSVLKINDGLMKNCETVCMRLCMLNYNTAVKQATNFDLIVLKLIPLHVAIIEARSILHK